MRRRAAVQQQQQQAGAAAEIAARGRVQGGVGVVWALGRWRGLCSFLAQLKPGKMA